MPLIHALDRPLKGAYRDLGFRFDEAEAVRSEPAAGQERAQAPLRERGEVQEGRLLRMVAGSSVP
ncbi:hypothetical protein GCM10009550_61680 [Actinocorallia libanotica]|uniref:Uncharacterized protein n=1 Tax=Actinocorallia libanotica TaxID=46162 RepID=A0ABN1RUL7_9ACTN